MKLNVVCRLSDSLSVPCKKRGVFGKNLVKAQFHIKTGFIFLFYCHTVSQKLTVKKGKFCGKFFEKVEIFRPVS